MREILFRGKATNREPNREYKTNYKNGDWVYGLLTNVENYMGFAEMTNEIGVSGIDVDKNTIGQYTGLTDKNGTKIFEGDIVKAHIKENFYTHTNNYEGIYEVKYHDKYCYFYLAKSKNNLLFDGNWDYFLSEIEVIGNIHDNPELLGGSENGSN